MEEVLRRKSVGVNTCFKKEIRSPIKNTTSQHKELDTGKQAKLRASRWRGRSKRGKSKMVEE